MSRPASGSNDVPLTAAQRACTVCKGRTYVVEGGRQHAFARVCSCSQPCPHCNGQGHVYGKTEQTFSEKVGPRTYDVISLCACKKQQKRLAQFNAAEIPAVLAHGGFESYRPAVPEQDRAKMVAQSFALGYARGKPSPGFILSGPVGTGKTHLIAATLSHLALELGIEVRYQEISLLYAEIRRGFQQGKSGGEIIGPLSEVELLAIDELGKGRGSPFELETMDELIARRYNAGRTTLFATNYSLAARKPELGRTTSGYRSTEDLRAAKDSEILRERVGERIYSRLCEMCEFVELPANAPDHRYTRHEVKSARR